MNKYRFTINGNEVDNPEGWKNFELRLKRDDDIAGLLVSSTNKFTFSGTGYDAIKTRFDNNYNDKISATIYVLEDGSYVEKYKGVIILTDVLFNLEKRTAQTTIEDASFQGAIQSNKNVKAILDSGFTKNGEEVDVPTVYNLDYFNASGNPLSLSNRRAYLLKDALDFLVRFMTDDEVKGVQSAYLDDTDNFDGYLPYITTGQSIRQESQNAPNVSFVDIMTFLQRTHDLTFDFVTVSGDIVMRIEERAFFFESTNVDTFRDLTDLTVNIDAQKIASHLEVGNNTFKDSGNCSSSVRFFAFQKEDYALLGRGNIDKLLDLTTDFVTDSNVIEFIVANLSNDTYDDDIVIVQASTTLARAFTSTNYCSNDPYYNATFTNDRVINRNLNAIPSGVSKYLGAETTPAKASSGSAVILNTQSTGLWGIPSSYNIDWVREVNPLVFDNEIYDIGGNFDAIAPDTYYSCPFSGEFSFKLSVYTRFKLIAIHHISNFVNISYEVVLEHWNNAKTTLKGSKSNTITNFGWAQQDPSTANVHNILNQVSQTINCHSGDRIYGKVIFKARAGVKNIFKILTTILASPHATGTWLECSGSEDDGGTYKEFDPNSFKARLYKFQKNVSLQRTDNIRNNTRSSVIINELSDTSLDKTVWIEEMVNNVETSETSFTMIN